MLTVTTMVTPTVIKTTTVTTIASLTIPGSDANGSDDADAATLAEVEAFLVTYPVDPEAAGRLRQLPPHLQRKVLERGDLRQTRNPSAVLIVRVRDAEQGILGQASASDGIGQAAPPPPLDAHPGVESLIATYNLDARAASLLRALSCHKQDMAAQIDLAHARQPSAYIEAQLRQAKFLEETPLFSGQAPGSLDSTL